MLELTPPKSLWLDCDPGHDDVMAMVLAYANAIGPFASKCPLVGVSSVHGNAPLQKTTNNALRTRAAIKKDAKSAFPVYRGAIEPVIREARYAPGIHGQSGLDGTDLLPAATNTAPDGDAVPAMYAALKAHPGMTIVATGPLTNVALLIKTYSDAKHLIGSVFFMGGAIGLGNYSSQAEFNILADPEGAQIVLTCPELAGKLVMVPLEVTHMAIADKEILRRLDRDRNNFRRLLFELMTFFAQTYIDMFDMTDGPPVHDPCAVAFALMPELCTKVGLYRVDVECATGACLGRTAVDFLQKSNLPPNVYVTEALDHKRFWELMLQAIEIVEPQSPLY